MPVRSIGQDTTKAAFSGWLRRSALRTQLGKEQRVAVAGFLERSQLSQRLKQQIHTALRSKEEIPYRLLLCGGGLLLFLWSESRGRQLTRVLAGNFVEHLPGERVASHGRLKVSTFSESFQI